VPNLAVRQIEKRDLPACIAVFDVAQRELYQRANQPWLSTDPTVMGRLLEHLVETSPERAWLAEERGSPIAFGMAVERGRFRFLSFLFVRPEVQARGIGRELFRRCVGDGNGVAATCVDALQPISTGLYATFGLVPRVPLFTLLGRLRSPLQAELPNGITASGFDAEVAGPGGHGTLAETVNAIDDEVLGFTRPVDHRYWRREGRQGVLYRNGRSVVAYGYVQPSGRVGPTCLLEPTLGPAVVTDLMRRAQPPDAWNVVIPGVARGTLRMLLVAGLRFEGTPALYSATEQSIDFERYYPSGFALP
jgi:GNAT superfamily N-acetyltransferase